MSILNSIKKIFSYLGRRGDSSDSSKVAEQQPETPRRTWSRRMGDWFRGALTVNKVVNDKQQPTSDSESGKKNQGAPPQFKDIPIEVNAESLIAPGIERYIQERGADFWIMGFNDGVKNIDKNTVEEVCKAHAFNLVEWVRANSHGKLMSYKSEKEVKESIMEDEGHRYEDAQCHLEEMTTSYQKNPRSFSWLLFILYFSIAIFLIIADVPLAKILTEKGFDLEVGSMASWLLTFGIAFCAVYVKIYYDDYVATNLGHYIGQFKRLPGIKGDRKRKKKSEKKESVTLISEENPEQEKRDIKGVQIEYWIKFLVKTLILYLVLYTIWVLGEFRYQNITNPERNIIMEYVLWVVEKMGKDPKLMAEHAFNVTLLAFRMITLIFPVIGGVCLSLAMTNLQNLRRYSKANADYSKHQKLYLDALGEFNKASKIYEDFQGVFDEWSKNKPEEHTNRYARIFNAFYLLGYQNGSREPDFFEPNVILYDQVENLRRKLIARRTQNVLQLVNE
jgi:hypothetical protein